jgi:hypothetical protein
MWRRIESNRRAVAALVIAAVAPAQVCQLLALTLDLIDL